LAAGLAEEAAIPSIEIAPDCVLAFDHYALHAPWTDPDPIVLVHGFSKNRKFWYEWIPALARHWPVFNVDLRGHGESSPVAPDFAMALEPFAADLVAFLDGVGLRSAHFVLAEFTSSVGLVLATRYPERVRSLVLPGFGYDWRPTAKALASWVDILEREGAAAWARHTVDLRLPADADPALRDWYVAEQGRMDWRLLAKLFRFSPTLDLTALLPQVGQPTLLMGGSLAQQGSLALLRKAADLIPDCELRIFEGMPFNVMTSCADACVAETVRFLRQRTTG
jgi:pimeloyl-ACP methyl ester carboxylesterase